VMLTISSASDILTVATGVYVGAADFSGDVARAGLDGVATAFRTRALAADVVTRAITFAALTVVAIDGDRAARGYSSTPRSRRDRRLLRDRSASSRRPPRVR
jgi:hypothetical protein